jgi:hypothetical protein
VDGRGRLAGAIGALCVLAVCCGAVGVGGFMLVGGAGINVQDLAGGYHHADGGEIVLDMTGTFTSRGITIEFDGQTLTLSGRGTWSLRPHDDGFGDISLGFAERRFATNMEISGNRMIAVPMAVSWYDSASDSVHRAEVSSADDLDRLLDRLTVSAAESGAPFNVTPTGADVTTMDIVEGAAIANVQWARVDPWLLPGQRCRWPRRHRRCHPVHRQRAVPRSTSALVDRDVPCPRSSSALRPYRPTHAARTVGAVLILLADIPICLLLSARLTNASGDGGRQTAANGMPAPIDATPRLSTVDGHCGHS